MIDRIAFWIFGTLDNWCAWVDKMFVSKPKKKKNEKR